MNETRKRRLRDIGKGPATLISEGCTITGKLSGEGNFMISGEVDGECDLQGTVTLTRSGTWRGLLSATSVIVAGTVDGDVNASDRVEITNTARISGSVTGEAIAVAEGAIVEGTMRTTGNDAPRTFVEKRDGGDEASQDGL